MELSCLPQIQSHIGHSYGKRAPSIAVTAHPGVKLPHYNGAHMRALIGKGRLKEALEIFEEMCQEGIPTKGDILIPLLQGCINLKAMTEAKKVYAHFLTSGLKPNLYIANTFLHMLCKHGSLLNALQVFDSMPQRNVFTWTIMIAGHAQHGQYEAALKLFWQMEQKGVQPDDVTFVRMLKVCSSLKSLEQGRKMHAHIIKCGYESDAFVGSTLVDMYAKCGSLQEARLAFDKLHRRDVVSFTAMIAGYAEYGLVDEAFGLFHSMQMEGVKPDEFTFASILKACASAGALSEGKQIHAHIVRSRFGSNIFIGAALVNMYAKCGSIQHAQRVFDNMPRRNTVLCTAMITGYVQHGYPNKALDLFWQMQAEGMKPDSATFVMALRACASIMSLEQGKHIHTSFLTAEPDFDVSIGNSLIDMYAKCGSLNDARQVFNKMFKRDLISWNVMIAGYTQHGDHKEALRLVHHMQQEGTQPDHITFISILSACTHAGLVEEGCEYYNSMLQVYCITPTVKHYACMVDLLGRAGHVEEAKEFLSRMHVKPGNVLWVTLLGASRTHGNLELAKHVSECIVEWEPENADSLLLLSNLHAAVHNWDSKAKVRKLMEASF